jgi:hypothetical protein
MAFLDPALERMIRHMQENDRLLRDHLAILRSPIELEMKRALAFARDSEQIARQATEFRTMQHVVEAAQLSLAATSAFDSFYLDMERTRRQWHDVRRSLEETQLLYEQSQLASLFTSRIQGDLLRFTVPALEPLAAQLAGLTHAGETVLSQLASAPPIMASLPNWHLQAPTLLPFAAATSLIALGATKDGAVSGHAEHLDSVLDEVGESVEEALQRVSVELVAPYRGACAALRVAGPDWQRHVGASVRSVVGGLLDALAPESALITFFPDPEAHKSEGRFTRRAQLMFVFREVAIDGYARMAENDIDMTLSTFYPANTNVHQLVSNLTPQQGRVFLRRVQGCLATILATLER